MFIKKLIVKYANRGDMNTLINHCPLFKQFLTLDVPQNIPALMADIIDIVLIFIGCYRYLKVRKYCRFRRQINPDSLIPFVNGDFCDNCRSREILHKSEFFVILVLTHSRLIYMMLLKQFNSYFHSLA